MEEGKSPWTPVAAPQREVAGERDDLMNRLDRLGVRVAGADECELSELRDITQWQEERAVEDREKARRRPANIQSDVPAEKISEGLREVNEYKRRRNSASPRKYW